ncbi:MAG: NAD(P)H-hydrate epimerase, partial [Dysgonamonadaceae bacterium]|nr:NAD(P)H-hydrate epimerase [Dysgonamonadaceae bacterium]
MKILSAEQIRAIDERTISEEGIFSYDLMERAANAFYEWFIINYPDQMLSISVISGVGNNGGDGLVIARLLKS